MSQGYQQAEQKHIAAIHLRKNLRTANGIMRRIEELMPRHPQRANNLIKQYNDFMRELRMLRYGMEP